jgi:hypothetical protein
MLVARLTDPQAGDGPPARYGDGDLVARSLGPAAVDEHELYGALEWPLDQ